MIRVVDNVMRFVILAKNHCNSSTTTRDACMASMPITHPARVPDVFIDTVEASSARTAGDRAAVAWTIHERAYKLGGVIGGRLVLRRCAGGRGDIADADVFEGPVVCEHT